MKTVAILHGWAEGTWESKKLRQAMIEQGYSFTIDTKEADLVIGHSLGCYLVPSDAAANLIVLIGLPYWPGRSVLTSVTKKLIGEIKFHRADKSLAWWLNKILHNAWYILTKPQLTYYGLTRCDKRFLPKTTTRRKVLIIRPQEDTFCNPDVVKILDEAKDYKFAEPQGAHDDCWINPGPYIDLILKHL